MAAHSDWLYELSERVIQELEIATDAVARRGIADLRKPDFTLPMFYQLLSQIRSDVLGSCGFVLLRRLPERTSFATSGELKTWSKCDCPPGLEAKRKTIAKITLVL